MDVLVVGSPVLRAVVPDNDCATKTLPGNGARSEEIRPWLLVISQLLLPLEQAFAQRRDQLFGSADFPDVQLTLGRIHPQKRVAHGGRHFDLDVQHTQGKQELAVHRQFTCCLRKAGLEGLAQQVQRLVAWRPDVVVAPDPTVVIDGANSRIVATISENINGGGLFGPVGAWETPQRVDLADLDLSGVTPTYGTGTVTWSAVPATLSESASPFATYPQGPGPVALDPITVTVSTD